MSSYANIRELLPVEGQRVVSVTQHDEADWLCGLPAYVMLIFENGYTLRVLVTDDETAWFGAPEA